jgi:hypothetical protein
MLHMHMAQLATLHTTDPPGCTDCSCSAMSNSETAPVLSTCKQRGNACVPCRTTHELHARQTAIQQKLLSHLLAAVAAVQ